MRLGPLEQWSGQWHGSCSRQRTVAEKGYVMRLGERRAAVETAVNSRALRTTLRTLHVLAFGAYYGGHVFGVEAERLAFALLAVVTTGILFMFYEIARAPVWIHQLRGVCTYFKIVLLAASGVFWDERVWILTAIVVIGVVVSHAPGSFRYYSLLERRVIESHGKG